LISARTPGQEEAAVLDSDAAYASMVALRNGTVVLAWEQGGVIVVKALD
jgi:hypothetical protein